LSQEVFEQFVKETKNDPVRFVKEYLGVVPDPWQAEVLSLIASGERAISVKSGHGVGKSTFASWAMLWYLLTRYPVKVVCTSPTSSQLFDALFAELKRWINELPPQLNELLNVKSDRIELIAAPTEAFISARTSRAENPESLQGVHSESVLLVADEASAIPEAVYLSAAGSMSGHAACTLLLGNPTRNTGYFYDTHNKLRDRWVTRTISCVDSPRVSDDFVREIAERFGEHSNNYRVRVIGEFPLQEDDTVIPYHLVDSAQKRDIEPQLDAPEVWGLDVARKGGDFAVLCKRQGTVIKELIKWKDLDLMELCGAVKFEYDQLHPSAQPVEIAVDAIGMGAMVCDRFMHWNMPAVSINVSEASSMKAQYLNLRAELWFKIKTFLENRDCKIPMDEALAEELLATRFNYTTSGKIKIESKDEMRKRGLRSPDNADAFALCMASDAITALRGNVSHHHKWSQPIRRNMQGVA